MKPILWSVWYTVQTDPKRGVVMCCLFSLDSASELGHPHDISFWESLRQNVDSAPNRPNNLCSRSTNKTFVYVCIQQNQVPQESFTHVSSLSMCPLNHCVSHHRLMCTEEVFDVSVDNPSELPPSDDLGDFSKAHRGQTWSASRPMSLLWRSLSAYPIIFR